MKEHPDVRSVLTTLVVELNNSVLREALEERFWSHSNLKWSLIWILVVVQSSRCQTRCLLDIEDVILPC